MSSRTRIRHRFASPTKKVALAKSRVRSPPQKNVATPSAKKEAKGVSKKNATKDGVVLDGEWETFSLTSNDPVENFAQLLRARARLPTTGAAVVEVVLGEGGQLLDGVVIESSHPLIKKRLVAVLQELRVKRTIKEVHRCCIQVIGKAGF